MSKKLPEYVKLKLQPLETELKICVKNGNTERAIEIVKEIQRLFNNIGNRTHFRLLRAKLWAFEASIDDKLTYSATGFEGIRKLANNSTRLYLEATSLLAICCLRQKKIEKAKKLIKEVILKINNIQSERRRHQYQKRFIQRVEEECILAELIGSEESILNPKDIHDKAVLLIQQNSDEDIYKLIGNSIPNAAVFLLKDVRDYGSSEKSVKI